MKIIGFEEHYGLPAIYEAAKKANDPYLQVLETLKKAGHFPETRKPGSQQASMIWARGGSPPWTTPVSMCGRGLQIVDSLNKALRGNFKQTFGPRGSKFLLIFPLNRKATVIAGRMRNSTGAKPEARYANFRAARSMATLGAPKQRSKP